MYRIVPLGAYGERPHVRYVITGSLWGEAACTVLYHQEPMGRGRMYRIVPPGAYGERPHVRKNKAKTEALYSTYCTTLA